MNKIRNVFNNLPLLRNNRLQNFSPRIWMSQDDHVTEEEIKSVLEKKFPVAKTITVEDVSGGCGAMFNIFIETSDFKGLSVVKQHKTVYESLNEQIKKIHGLHLETKVA